MLEEGPALLCRNAEALGIKKLTWALLVFEALGLARWLLLPSMRNVYLYRSIINQDQER